MQEIIVFCGSRCWEGFREDLAMLKAYVCPGCGTRYSRKPQVERGERCPVCNRRKQRPLIYWRVVGVALGTTTLLLITLMFALKAWADSRRLAAPRPNTEEQSSLPTIVERPAESLNFQSGQKPEPTKKESPAPIKEEIPSKPNESARPQMQPAAPPAKPEIDKSEI